MYEDKTRDSIHSDMLGNINNEYDKTVGSFIYDSTKPVSIELEKLYKDMNELSGKMDIENLVGIELERFIKQRTGITKKSATKAKGTLTVNGNGIVRIGDLFETEIGIQFVAIEEKQIVGSGTVSIECVQSGIIGNVPSNQITQIPITLEGIVSCTNTEPTKDGFEAENDLELRQRYYERIQTPSTSGNKAHYKNWAKEVIGVGDARVFPLWNGDNTVKVVIVDSDRQPASIELIHQVQQYIDPNSSGLGEGTAPIGAYCTVQSAIAKTINISFTAIRDVSFTDEEMIQSIENNITQYFKEIAFKSNYVSFAKIGSIIFDSAGIQDYTDLLITGGTSNIIILEEEVPVLGGVVIA